MKGSSDHNCASCHYEIESTDEHEQFCEVCRPWNSITMLELNHRGVLLPWQSDLLSLSRPELNRLLRAAETAIDTAWSGEEFDSGETLPTTSEIDDRLWTKLLAEVGCGWQLQRYHDDIEPLYDSGEIDYFMDIAMNSGCVIFEDDLGPSLPEIHNGAGYAGLRNTTHTITASNAWEETIHITPMQLQFGNHIIRGGSGSMFLRMVFESPGLGDAYCESNPAELYRELHTSMVSTRHDGIGASWDSKGYFIRNDNPFARYMEYQPLLLPRSYFLAKLFTEIWYGNSGDEASALLRACSVTLMRICPDHRVEERTLTPIGRSFGFLRMIVESSDGRVTPVEDGLEILGDSGSLWKLESAVSVLYNHEARIGMVRNYAVCIIDRPHEKGVYQRVCLYHQDGPDGVFNSQTLIGDALASLCMSLMRDTTLAETISQVRNAISGDRVADHWPRRFANRWREEIQRMVRIRDVGLPEPHLAGDVWD